MAFDFDEMEAEAAARLENGVEDEPALLALAASVDPPRAWTGALLPPMRNLSRPGCKNCWPSVRDLPKYLPKMQLTEPAGSGQCKLRLFCFYGAGDSVANWVNFMMQMPAWADIAIFEAAGHGLRSHENGIESVLDCAKEAFTALTPILNDHAFEGNLEGAPFAFVGHSMGVQVAIEVAVLCKRTLGLEPCSLFCIDRGAPHLKLYTDEGYEMLCSDEPQEFFEGFNPMIYRLMLRPTRHGEKETERMIRMWQNDLTRSQEHIWQEGCHVFRCDIHVFRAIHNFALDHQAKLGPLNPDFVRYHEINCKITCSGSESSSPWSWDSYEDWKKWTAGECCVHDVEAGHVEVKDHCSTIDVIKTSLQRFA